MSTCLKSSRCTLGPHHEGPCTRGADHAALDAERGLSDQLAAALRDAMPHIGHGNWPRLKAALAAWEEARR